MSRLKMRNLVIILLVSTIIILCAGFVILSQQLEELKNTNQLYNVEFTKIEVDTLVKGKDKNPTITSSITNAGTKANITLKMANPNDYIVYTVTIKNKGDLPGEIVDIVETPNVTNNENIKPVNISYNDVIGKVLEPGETLKLKVTAVYNQSDVKKEFTIPYALTLVTKQAIEE